MLGVLRQFAEVHVVALAQNAKELAVEPEIRTRASDVTLVPVAHVRNKVRAAAGLLGTKPLTHFLLDGPRFRSELARIARSWRPDVVLAYCSGMARFAMEPPLAGLPFVLDMVDVDSLKWEALADNASVPMRWIYGREAVCLGAFERAASTAAAAALVVNRREANALAHIAPEAAIHVVGIGVDVEGHRPPGGPAAGKGVVFTGVFDYAPNEMGALWFGKDVWPLVRERHPEAKLLLVGMGPTRRLHDMAASDPSITITGGVPAVTTYLWRSALSVAPIHVARGTQNKVLEAAAAGLPSVVTPAVFDGLPDAVRHGCVVAGDARAFADGVAELLDLSPTARRARAERVALSELTWERALAPLRNILIGAMERSASTKKMRELARAVV
jgi:sugar transferase (PEP-CTERM/EpsH1 system associated)